MESGFLVPALDEPISAPFWEGCARGELLVQACRDCGTWAHPPRPMCPHCRSLDRTFVPTSGTGRIWSYVVPHPPLLPAYTRLAPYNVIVVELAENPATRFIGNLMTSIDGELNDIDPATIRIGEPVHVGFRTVDGVALPCWLRD